MTAPTAGLRPTVPLVEAKLHPPRPRPGTIDRPRLVRLLMAEPGPPVVSMIAPPGYGKTTVLAEWAARVRRPVAWLTLDDLDDDPTVLLSYLAVAFDRVQPVDGSILSALAATRQRILGTAVPRLASEMHRWGRRALIVLDDVHRLSDRTSLDAVAALLDHLPPGVRVAIAGRSEPGLPLARLRAAGRLLEVGPRLLALDETETGAMAAAAGYAPSVDEVRALTGRTEGWAAGIYLAALARAHGTDTSDALGNVSGRDPYIAEYLRSEFERGLSDSEVTFLTRTAVLETVSPSTAEAVTGLTGAEERLRTLAHDNLLIQEIGASGGSYRYHNLLRDFLQAELERREPGATRDLHRRAASWYATAGNVDLAVEHATMGGDADAAARLVTAAALPTFYRGHAATLERWLGRFEEPVYERHPPLAVIAAWIHLLNGRPDAADRMADIAERVTFDGPPGDGSATFESQRAMLRAIMARRGPMDVLADAELAVSQEGHGSGWSANALWLLGSAHLLLGEVDAADARFEEAVAAGSSAQATGAVVLAKRGSIAIGRGDWEAAERYVAAAREWLLEGHSEEMLGALVVHAVGARSAINRGDLDRGRGELVHAQIVRPLASRAAPWYSVDALLELARAYLALSDVPGAQVVVREAEEIVRRRPALGILTTDLIEIRRRLADAASTLAGSSTLTGAELRLLPLLPTYLSFQDIADRLLLSRNTVKTHAMSIYGKLQASSRGEAVERAVELGLLEPFPRI